MATIVQPATLRANNARLVDSMHQFSIVYVLSGMITATTGAQTLRCRTNEYMLFAEGEQTVLAHADEASASELLVMTLDPASLSQYGRNGEDLCACFRHPRLAGHRLIDSHHRTNLLLRDLLSRLSREEADLFAIESYRHSIIIMVIILAGRAFLSQLNTDSIHGQHSLSVNEIYYYITDHIHEELTLDQLANDLHFSKHYIAHTFKRQVGIPLHRYILQKKLQYARDLVLKGIPVIEVYKICGFGDYSHFIRAYKSVYGITPRKHYHQIQQQLRDALYSGGPPGDAPPSSAPHS